MDPPGMVFRFYESNGVLRTPAERARKNQRWIVLHDSLASGGQPAFWLASSFQETFFRRRPWWQEVVGPAEFNPPRFSILSWLGPSAKCAPMDRLNRSSRPHKEKRSRICRDFSHDLSKFNCLQGGIPREIKKMEYFENFVFDQKNLDG